MHLSPAQLQTLKSAIDADGTMAAFPMTTDGYTDLATYLNQSASPDYLGWKTALSQMTLQQNTASTSFDWASAGGFIARSQGERDAYRTLFQPGSVNPSFTNVRAALDDIFSGSGVGAVANRAHWRVAASRKLTRFEKVFAVATVGGSGTRGSAANPDTLGTSDVAGEFLTSPINAQHVEEARNLA